MKFYAYLLHLSFDPMVFGMRNVRQGLLTDCQLRGNTHGECPAVLRAMNHFYNCALHTFVRFG